MLYILFSPSEGKNQGGTDIPLKLFAGVEPRKEILDRYQEIVASKEEEMIKGLFGFKKIEECQNYISDIYTSSTLKAIMRYSGVAYDYLQYETLDQQAQEFIDKHTLIFSNLFGPIFADNMIPIYKVKQGNSIGDIKPEEFYKQIFCDKLDKVFEDAEILDLRAGYYNKFYKPKYTTTIKFLKNAKVVSHWVKAYRGIVLREIAKNNLTTIEEITKMEIENLMVKEIKKTKTKTELVYEIIK